MSMTDRHGSGVIDVFGDPVEIRVSSQSTQNAFFVGVQTTRPGGGPPPHLHHREDEFFLVLEGEFEFFDGKTWTKILPGGHAVGMRNSFHTFRNSGTSVGRIMFIVTPGGLDEYFAEISPLAMPADAIRLAEINRMYGIVFAEAAA